MKKVLLAMGLIFVISVAVIGVTYYQQKAQELAIWEKVIGELSDFQMNLTGLDGNSKDTDAAYNQLTLMKKLAEKRAKNMINLMQASNSLGNTTGALILRDIIKRAQNYFLAFANLASLSTTEKGLLTNGDSLMNIMAEYRKTKTAYLPPFDRSDLQDGEAMAIKLVGRLQALKKQAEKAKSLASAETNAPRVIYLAPSNNPYWTNPAYSDYYTEIRRIVAEYNQGRNVLSAVLSHWDHGVFDRNGVDSSNLQGELRRRRDLRDQLNALSANCPAGSIYKEHQVLLLTMIENAIMAMEQFDNQRNIANRKYISAVSQENTRIFARIKRFYGIR